ncbi:putative toxin-antitoxin system, antitoxin component, AbrB famil [Lactobacillus gasseri SV-16A-US]|jgi:hypothetical protein|nr:putative toxin-antitoxin system, antitoxin component, AbrB famil [Lactobacillus gasseri SV-16A-US]
MGGFIMQTNALKNETKMFKAGNSWNFRVTSKDRKALDADQNTVFEKIIDPNGEKIIFKKMKSVDPSLDSFMDKFYQKHGDLMKELEDK